MGKYINIGKQMLNDDIDYSEKEYLHTLLGIELETNELLRKINRRAKKMNGSERTTKLARPRFTNLVR
jgi:hypothetical protein